MKRKKVHHFYVVHFKFHNCDSVPSLGNILLSRFGLRIRKKKCLKIVVVLSVHWTSWLQRWGSSTCNNWYADWLRRFDNMKPKQGRKWYLMMYYDSSLLSVLNDKILGPWIVKYLAWQHCRLGKYQLHVKEPLDHISQSPYLLTRGKESTEEIKCRNFCK